MIKHIKIRCAAAFLGVCLSLGQMGGLPAAADADVKYDSYGGGYAATQQLSGVGYTTELYDASNGLPTSDAMFLLSGSDGRMWIGGYSGVICYDGTTFEQLDPANGLTSSRGLFEDSKGRIWVATNDNGVVVIDKHTQTHLTYRDGLPSSSVRIFAEDADGNVCIGTTSGLCYADENLHLHELSGTDLSGERVLKLDADANGRIYGQTTSGTIFAIDHCEITECYQSRELHLPKITTIMADPEHAGNVWLGTEDGMLYYGAFGETAAQMQGVSAEALGGSIHWLSYDCGRVWASSTSAVGYVDEADGFHLLQDLPVNSGIEMTTADYQGNLWIASSAQGVMKLVTNNFMDVTGNAGIPREVANAAYLSGDTLYIGTDTGLRMLDADGEEIRSALTANLGGTKIRCITEDPDGNLWFATYTDNRGLCCYSPSDRKWQSYTVEDGMPDNQVRCVAVAEDGSMFAGTNGGLAVIRDGKVVRTAGSADGIGDTVFLTVAQTADGSYLAGTDGGGIYVIGEDEIRHLGRDDGLTSDVVMRIIPDEKRNVCWIVTSNSIEMMRDGTITPVTTFPYHNNYDLFFDDNGFAWVLSSCGIYVVDADEMLADHITDYSLYTMENGLPYAITANARSALDADGNLYIPGRNGIIKVNINHYYKESEQVLTGVRSITCDEERIYPDADGIYHLLASRGRIRIAASVMDYTVLGPTVHVWLEGVEDNGITAQRSQLSELEYTNLPYGKYTLHIQLVDKVTGEVMQDDTYRITKAARVSELLMVRILLLVLLALVVGFIVWRTMRSTVIAKQYDEIRKAKEDAERANTAKSRFLANMSHEIRTPINTIMGMNEMAMREDADGVPQGYFMAMMNYAFDIRSASETLLNLINDLLDISKVESGKMHLVEQEYDVQELLRSMIAMVRVQTKEKGLHFDVAVDEILPRRLYGDADKIKQIVLNFLTNAVKYTNTGGLLLSVSMQERTDETATLRFSVKDTGIGIREEDIPRLFNAYERLDEKQNSGIQGTGLGLDISRRFAELLGGKLHCESVYREGSEFTLTLPQKIRDDTPVGIFTEQSEHLAGGPYIPQFIAPDADILIVDDNPTNLNVMKGLLRATRAFVTTSTSGEDALDKIRDSHFDVVFLDIIMPGMDGLTVIEKIREFNTTLPVYAITAAATQGDDFYRAKGFNGYLAKPIDGEDLERTIMRHIPDAMMEKPARESETALTDLPAELRWLYDVKGISVTDGIRSAGGVETYIFALKMFLDTIDGNAKVLREAYESGNIRLYMVKIHALSLSASIIGALELSALASKLEEAGKWQNFEVIRETHDQLMTDYVSYREALSRLKQQDAS